MTRLFLTVRGRPLLLLQILTTEHFVYFNNITIVAAESMNQKMSPGKHNSKHLKGCVSSVLDKEKLNNTWNVKHFFLALTNRYTHTLTHTLFSLKYKDLWAIMEWDAHTDSLSTAALFKLACFPLFLAKQCICNLFHWCFSQLINVIIIYYILKILTNIY